MASKKNKPVKREVEVEKAAPDLPAVESQSAPQPIPAPNPNNTISLICPALNQGKFIEPLIRSIREGTNDQNLPRIEFCLCDDGSTDGTGDIAKAVCQELGIAFRYKRNQKPTGCGPARNDAFYISTKRYIWPVDGDDKVLPGGIDEIFRVLDSGDFDVVLCNVKGSTPDAIFTATTRRGLARSPVGAWAKCYKREFFIEYPDFHPEDAVPHFLLCDRVNRIASTSKQVYEYNKTNVDSISRSLEFFQRNPRNLEQMAFTNEIEQVGIRKDWIPGILRNTARMFELRDEIKDPEVKAVWAERFKREVANLMTGHYAH